jgi:hypothetical protein
MNGLSSTSRSSTSSPLTTQIPNLSPAQIAALPYPPDLFPGARDVQTSYGTMRVYEWGNEAGRKVMLVHGDATCAPLWKHIAEDLVARGCRVIVLGKFLCVVAGWMGATSLIAILGSMIRGTS